MIRETPKLLKIQKTCLVEACLKMILCHHHRPPATKRNFQNQVEETVAVTTPLTAPTRTKKFDTGQMSRKKCPNQVIRSTVLVVEAAL
jgi:hypothetical protein